MAGGHDADGWDDIVAAKPAAGEARSEAGGVGDSEYRGLLAPMILFRSVGAAPLRCASPLRLYMPSRGSTWQVDLRSKAEQLQNNGIMIAS